MMGRAPAVVALGIVLQACVPDRPVRTEVDALTETLPCRTDVRRVLRAWSAGPRYLEGPPDVEGAPRYRIPAGAIGRWIVLGASRRGGLTLERWSDEPPFDERWPDDGSLGGRYERREVDAACRVVEGGTGGRVGPGSPPVSLAAEAPIRTDAHAPFTDADLRRLVAGVVGRGGGARAAVETAADPPVAVVVYVWSPHMPLSVDGYREIALAADALGMALVPVLIPGSDRAFALREAARVGMPTEHVRTSRSIELAMRDAHVHAPSILVFGRGRISPVLPGYRDAGGYRRYLEAFLGPG